MVKPNKMRYGKCRVIDTFTDFMSYWSQARSKNIEGQIKLWRTSYMAKYPELLKKQLRNYESIGLNWRDIAREKVFPKLPEFLPRMQEAKKNILAVCESVCERFQQTLNSNFEIIFVIYVGIGCGAGWATHYEGLPACLLGLENIVDCGWQSKDKLRGLITHELGHLIHTTWRKKKHELEPTGDNPLFQLYSEGFATRCERMILGNKVLWHNAPDKNWFAWCMQHKDWLAKEYLRRIEKNKPVRDFFGSWLDIKGKKYTGYFLGHEFICEMQKKNSLKKIALFNIREIRELIINYLRDMNN
ncbi:MAG: hypothetical protein V1709_06140 [Planctomycetota bacterium]